jgi:hypothetical protein
MRVDECIHALRIGQELLTRGSGERVVRSFGSGAEEQQPLFAVMPNGGRADGLRELSKGSAAYRVDLP